MSAVSDAFKASFGEPAPAVPVGFTFAKKRDQISWEMLQEDIGAGYFRDGFLYLFGPYAAALNGVLSHWSFLFPDQKDRKVIGYNAYGSLLVIEESAEQGTAAPIGVLDTLHVRYFTDPNLVFMNLIGHWLPQDKLPMFLDETVYQAWRQTSDNHLAAGEILAITEPISLGGAFQLNNFQVEPIEEYFATTGPIYRKALS